MAKDPTVVIAGLTGMDNLRETRGYLLNEAKMATPSAVLNADVREDGSVLPRSGYRKQCVLAGAHSLWAGTVMMCVSGDTVYRLDRNVPVAIATLQTAPSRQMHYEEHDDSVYLSNGFWNRVYDIEEQTTRPWGLPHPTPPTVLATAGSLPPGTYKLAYTRYVDGRLSGNSDLVEIRWQGGLFGLHLSNKPSNCLAWITQPNGQELCLAPVDSSGNITEPNYTQPLPTFGVRPPPPFTHMVYAHGRMWGAEGKYIWYSDEFRPEYFRMHQRLPVTEPIVQVAWFDGGLYVSSLRTTWALMGRDPTKMTLHRVGDGAIPGPVAYGLVDVTEYELSKKFTQLPAPMWASKTGFILGTHAGRLVHISGHRLRINPKSRVAALTRRIDGRPQVLFTFRGPSTMTPDPVLAQDFWRGSLSVPAPVTITPYGGLSIAGEGEFSL